MKKRKLSFKWFGSLTNLSSRQSASNKAASMHDGSHSGSRSALGSQSLDDMDSSLPSHAYACSKDMYSHVGTVPRRETLKKSWRGMKEKKEEVEEGGGQSKAWAGDQVRDSPLLRALSSRSLTSLDRPLPTTPKPTEASPLTLAADSCIRDPAGGVMKNDEEELKTRDISEPVSPKESLSLMAAGGSKVSAQDLYVPMDPITEAVHKDEQPERRHGAACRQETTKLRKGSQEVERVDRAEDSADSSGEYVKFSREKFWLEPPSEVLRRQLEEELKLSSTNLRSHAWYHGCIPWEVSESLVVNHGDFLVRDSESSQGNFVLTNQWEHKTNHFLIRKTVVQSSETYTRVQYSMDQEAFDSVPALIHFYIGSKAVLTRWSRAQIHRPVNRTLPLSYLETAFCSSTSPPTCLQEQKNSSLTGKERICPRSPSGLHQREDDLPPRPDAESHLTTTTPCNNPPQSWSPRRSPTASVAPSPSLSRRSDVAAPLSSSSTLPRQHNDTPQMEIATVSQDSPSTASDGSCYTELYPGPQSYVERLRVEDESLGVSQLRLEDANFSPVVETVSSFRPSRNQLPLMPKENKPLEVVILRRVKELLAEVDPGTAAKHITQGDCMVARILGVTPEMQRMMGVSSGMELLTLPHGHQLRLDLLERFQTMAIMLAVDVLGCTGTTEERAGLLHKIIQIAAELKSSMGNMFGFAAVMRALELPQVTRLEQTWTALRQRHTEGAILYEKTLRPFMKSLNDGRESCPLSSTTFPHVLPLLSLLEKSVAVGEGTEPWETVEAGVDVVMFHLGAARTIAQLGGIYRSNAESKLQGFLEQAEVFQLFQTDFQMRLLWGSRGAEESQALRYAKFDQVLTALSNRLEPPVRPR
ncbi:SH2 domain containing 3Cb [Aulostomus maculatus]